MKFFSFFVNLNLNNKIKNAKNKYMKILKGGKVMKVNECMCNDVCCVKPEDNVENVAKVMCNNHIGCVPVCDSNNCICGILTDRDIILRAIACDKDVKSTKVSDIMSTNVCTCKQDEEVSNVETKMANNQIRRLPVCNEKNQVIGILTIGNLANHDNQIGKNEVCTTIANICDCNGQTKNAE